MNGEEKILAMLEKMDGRLSKLEAGQAKLETGQAAMDGRLSKLESDMAFVKGAAMRIELDHGRQLSALFDGYAANTEKLDEHTETLERIERKVDRLELTTGVHDMQIKELKAK